MTLQEFKKSITKSSWFDKYYYYFISFAVIAVGLIFIYQALFPATKQAIDSRLIMIGASLFFIALGAASLYLIPNRYKVLAFENKSSDEVKKRIIADTMKEFDVRFIDNPNHFWSFRFQRKWWTFGYDVYLTFDNANIFASVVGRTYGRGGFIDFGQTERVRKRLNSVINQKLQQG